jgi:hypothetical protein
MTAVTLKIHPLDVEKPNVGGPQIRKAGRLLFSQSEAVGSPLQAAPDSAVSASMTWSIPLQEMRKPPD